MVDSASELHQMNRPTEFLQDVLREFDFLYGYGFAVFKTDPTLVQFKSDIYYINVYYGRRSWEINLEIGLVDQPPASSYSPGWFVFQSLVRVFDDKAGKAMPPAEPILTSEGVGARVRNLAEDFRRYIDCEPLKSHELWNRLKGVREKEIAESPWPKASSDEMQKRFDFLWETKRYAELVNFFQPLLKYLSDDERAKFDAAKTELSRPS